MNIEIPKKKTTASVNISVNYRGGKSLYVPKPEGEQISLSSLNRHKVEKRNANDENSRPKPIILSMNQNQNQEKTENNQPINISMQNNDAQKEETKQKDSLNKNEDKNQDKNEKSLNITFQKNDIQKEESDIPIKKEDKNEEKEYINSVKQFLNDFPKTNIADSIQNKIDSLESMIQKVLTFDDKILNETKIIISFINLYLDESIYNNGKHNDLYKIFFDNENNFIIESKLKNYFIYNDKNSIGSIIKFTKKISNINLDYKRQMIKCFQNIKQSYPTFSKEAFDILNETIDEIENEFNLAKKREFLFDEATMFNTIDDSELTNDYQKGWSSIQTYIKVMFNLTIENYFHPLRQHLKDLKNDELDPRDLYLYDHVKIYPSYEFNERSDYDLFIHFQIRAPNYKDGNTIKQRRIREIDWELTERLSNRSLLFFSFSPTMDKIEAVALSCAKKGTIQNNIIPILFLKGFLEMDKEYYMFEPVDHWNGPFYDNLLSTNELSLPKSLIKPIISLDFSDNLIDNLNSIPIHLMNMLRNQVGFKPPKFEILSANEEVRYYMNYIVSNLENREADKNALLNIIKSDICKYLKEYERKRGKYKAFDKNSDVVKGIELEMKRYTGFRIGNEKWPYDDFKAKDFRDKCYVDHEQYKPIKYCLSHHLTLVNGAPGTGKTYLACELIKLLIKSKYDHPILIVTYKNVSLDNLLDNLAKFLELSKIDFVRLGGRPRTENKFILSKIPETQIPLKVQRLKKQILYLTILGSKTKKSLEYLSNKKIDECSKFIINDIDKSINIREILYDKYPIFNKNEEEIITNFFDPSSMIPTADEYFQCWICGTDYYNKLKSKKNNELKQNKNVLLSEIIEFYYSKEGNEKKNNIIKIIKVHFLNNELLLRDFLYNHKKKITSKDISILDDIIFENKIMNHNDGSFYDVTQPLSDIKNYIRNTNTGMTPFEKQQVLKTKFNEMLSKKETIESFKQFINDLSVIIKDQVKESRELCSLIMKEFEKDEIKKIGSELSKKKLIAMTATRAAQYKLSLDRCNCEFMIIEEAGELTEPMAFSIIPKTIQHLVMIGDYRQLRPTVEHKLTFSPYNYHISLFEKEIIHSKSIKSDNLFTLSIQRRMHPQISTLLRKVFYNDNKDNEKLNDDESTYKLKKPFGIPNNVQFWLHDFEEEVENKKMRSHVNVKEAQICAYLFLLMLCRGYKSTEITIISLYKGQKRQIEKEICKLIDSYYNNPNLISYDAFDFENDLSDSKQEKKEINELIEIRKSNVGKFVVCLDDFQGEENEVIIVSLTRSEKPGFVKNENRALVTLSRARQMEFIIGNKNVFGPQNQLSPLWQKITKEASLIDEHAMHFNGIACCQCPIHSKQQKVVILNKPNDFIECRFNCCTEKCSRISLCGHRCQLPCHVHSSLNEENDPIFKRRYYCEEKCKNCCLKGHHCDEVCGNCMHFGCPPCPYNCPGICSTKFCNNKCSLPCSHSGPCQCLCVGYCNDCHTQITELHDKLKIWNQSVLVCTKCFYKRVEWRRNGYPDNLYPAMNA